MGYVPILEAKKLADKIYLMVVKAPRISANCKPGEFVIVKMDEKGERIPLTICDYDREKETITSYPDSGRVHRAYVRVTGRRFLPRRCRAAWKSV